MKNPSQWPHTAPHSTRSPVLTKTHGKRLPASSTAFLGMEGNTVKHELAAYIAGQLLATAGNVRHGSASVTLKVHEGRIVDITHTVTTSTRERGRGHMKPDAVYTFAKSKAHPTRYLLVTHRGTEIPGFPAVYKQGLIPPSHV